MKPSQSPDNEPKISQESQTQETSSHLAEDYNAKSLQTPFQDARVSHTPTARKTKMLTIKPSLPKETLPELPLDVQNAPLPDTAISTILHAAKPSCTKAQTWIEAQRASDQERARTAYKAMKELSAKMQSKQHVRLEKVAALRLAQKVREMRMRQGQLSQNSSIQDSDAMQGREKLVSSQERVQQANLRLQKALRVAQWD